MGITHQRHQILLRNPISFPPQAESDSPSFSPLLKWSMVGRWTGPKGQRFIWLLDQVLRPFLEKHRHLQLNLIGGDFEDLNFSDKQILIDFIDCFSNQVQWIGKSTSLLPYFESSHTVLGGGRVALEALAQGAQVIALGEASFEGRVSLSNLESCLRSNFGDIAPGATFGKAEAIYQELEDALKNPLSKDDRKLLTSKIRDEFDHKVIAHRLERIYGSGLVKLHHPAWIPILMYHQVVLKESSSPHKIYVTVEKFEEQLRELRKQNFTPLHFQDLLALRQHYVRGNNSKFDFPKKPILLTFDDGYLNNLTLALPLLEKYSMKATVFLLAENQILNNEWDKESGSPEEKLLDPSQRKILATNPLIEIGSHGFRHQKMTDFPHPRRFYELSESKKILEKEFEAPIWTYAYTYGVRSEDASTLAESSGYSFAVNTDRGGLHHEEDPFSIFRVSVFPQDGSRQIRKKTSSWYRKYYFLKRRK
jgi:peptidoglycan/xylan/chitin deacetylase (PgdA/CDA1 family)